MSNGCLSLAINHICRARQTSTLPLKQVLSSFRKSASVARHGVDQYSTSAWQRTIRQGFNRNLVRHARQTHAASRTTTPGSLPDANLREGKKQASYTEGVQSEDSWRDYDPEGGLPLPDGELSNTTIEEIFGKDEVDTETGNYILCVMNWRRMSGSLIDVGIKFPAGSSVTSRQAESALDYLREAYPTIDEQKRAVLWAEEESQKLRQQLQDRAVRLGLYKADPNQEEEIDEQEEEVEEEQKQGTAYGRARTGQSMLERLRKTNVAKREAEESAAEIRIAQKERSLLSAARGPLELGGGLQQQMGVKRYGTFDVVLQKPVSSASLTQSEAPAWVKYYQDQAEIIKENIVPQMSTLRRLAPSALVFLLIISGCYYFGTHYTPPPTEARLFPSIPPSVATLGAITVGLVGMYVAGKVPPFWRAYNKYFALVPAYPYASSSVGAIFRHDTLAHLASNTAMLWIVGLTLHEDIGRGWFLATFLSAGVTGTMGALTFHVLSKNWSTYIYGASGATYGLLSTLCILRPQGTVHVFGYEVPFAAWVVLLLVGATNLRGVIRSVRYKNLQADNVDYLGHAFGLLSGVVTGLGLRARWQNDKTIAQRSDTPAVA